MDIPEIGTPGRPKFDMRVYQQQCQALAELLESYGAAQVNASIQLDFIRPGGGRVKVCTDLWQEQEQSDDTELENQYD